MASEPTKPILADHHGRQSWVTQWRDDQGHRRKKRFGYADEAGHREALSRFQNWLLTQWRVYEHIRNPFSPTSLYTVTRVAADYLRHARKIYVKNGKRTSHILQIKYAMRALRDFFGGNPAQSMESPDLAKLRDAMITGIKKVQVKDPNTGETKFVTQTYIRSVRTVNGRLSSIKDGFVFARECGKISRMTMLDLQAVKPLRKGRSAATDPKHIQPIDWSVAEYTKTALTRVVAGMIDVHHLTGMRPTDVCVMRACDIDMGGEVWIYSPHTWKTEHLDDARKVAIGPQAQAVIKKFLTTDTRAYLFSPAVAVEEFRAAQRAARKTPLGQGNFPGSKFTLKPRRRPGSRYTEQSYRKAIRRACLKLGIEPWHPNQLRHSFATLVKKEFGIMDASDSLGHAHVKTTEIYAEKSLERAIKVAKKLG